MGQISAKSLKRVLVSRLRSGVSRSDAPYPPAIGLMSDAERKEVADWTEAVFQLLEERERVYEEAQAKNCFDCGAPAGRPCYPEYGCDAISRAAGHRVTA